MEGKEKSRLRERLAKRYGDAANRGGELIVLHGGRGVTVYDCRRILHYSPSEICLRVGARAVSVTGKGLYCTSFSAGTVSVSGQVSGVALREDRGTGGCET